MITAPDCEFPLNDQDLRRAIDVGNIPCLVAVLYQLSGDTRWINAPYIPARTRGFEELDGGGLDENIKREIRDAAFEAILAWSKGADAAIAAPDDAQLVALMSLCMGEPIGPEFAPMVAEQLGFRPFVADDVRDAQAARSSAFKVVVIGAGVSGLASAFALRAAGVDFEVIEKNREVGGTWWENTYPGARVDIPSNLYSWSFTEKNWSEHFSRRDEIKDYIVDTVERHAVRENIRFGCEVQAAHWDEQAQRWRLQLIDANGQVSDLWANAIITATGLHNRPKIPSFAGQESFTGQVMHSARWPADAALEGKRVAVLGTGASAMQIVSAIAPKVESLLVLQRSPQWVAPNENYFKQTPDHTHYLFSHVPFYRQWYRFRLYWLYTERLYAGLVVDPAWKGDGKSVSKLNDVYLKFFTAYLQGRLEGREDLQRKALPGYPPFGKRILLDNGWFDTLKRPNVELLTDGVAQLTADGLVTSSGEHRQIDTLVLCTGFEQQRFLYPIDFYGRDGQRLHDSWEDDDARAYLGITSPGFPNLFYLYGPNTNPGSGSYINTAEAQVRYITRAITTMVRQGIGALECRPQPYERYNRELDEANNRMVYAQPGVKNYYRNSRGRVVTNSPWPMLTYWNLTRQPDLDDYLVTAAR